MSANSNISKALHVALVWDLTQEKLSAGTRGLQEQSRDERRKTHSSKFLRNFIYQTRRDMPLVRDGTA